jgi:hypothetical protein
MIEGQADILSTSHDFVTKEKVDYKWTEEFISLKSRFD